MTIAQVLLAWAAIDALLLIFVYRWGLILE
jgi:hypothetical protein